MINEVFHLFANENEKKNGSSWRKHNLFLFIILITVVKCLNGREKSHIVVSIMPYIISSMYTAAKWVFIANKISN